MVAKKIENLPTWLKVLLGIGGVIDVALRALALADIAKRPEDELNGPKKVWLPALSIVTSMGLLPTAYFLFGRRDDA